MAEIYNFAPFAEEQKARMVLLAFRYPEPGARPGQAVALIYWAEIFRISV